MVIAAKPDHLWLPGSLLIHRTHTAESTMFLSSSKSGYLVIVSSVRYSITLHRKVDSISHSQFMLETVDMIPGI
jgi:hypothetical protein